MTVTAEDQSTRTYAIETAYDNRKDRYDFEGAAAGEGIESHDPEHWAGPLVQNPDIIETVTQTESGNVLQLTFAILLNEVRSAGFKKTSQSLMFLPYFISDVLVSLLVYNLLNYDYGFISNLVRALGGEMPKVYQMAGAWPIIIVLVNLWKGTGYGTVVYFAAITGMDSSMLEAAQIDGANGFQRIRYIILPTLKPTVIILFLFAIGGILKGNFGLFYNLVGNNSMLFNTTDIIETYVYRSMMNSFNFSQSSAVGLFQSVVGFFIVMAANAFVKHLDPDYALF